MNTKDTNRMALPGGAIHRRDFLKQATALGAAGTAGITALSLPRKAKAAIPKGGHMRFGIGHGSTTDTLDPGKVLTGFLSATHYAVTNTLTEMDGNGKLVPKLAESWEASADAKKWIFKIRQGVEFHNGKTLTTDDVIASINHHRGEKSESSAKSMVDPITEIRADGNDVIVTLSGGDADFPYKLSSFNFPIYQANGDGSLNWQSGVGAGAYVLKSFEPGVRATYEKHANHWQDDRGHFASGELITIPDSATRQSALISGEVDGVDRLDFKTANRMAQMKGIVVEEVAGKTQYTFPMRTDTAPYDDNNVRMAIKHAIDREQLLRTILHGHGSVGNDQPISSAYPFFNTDLEQRQYDPDKAAYYLKQAGLSSLSINLSASEAAFAGAVDTAVLISEQAKKAGIKVTVKQEPKDGYWSNVWMQKPFCACYWPGYPTPDSILTQAYAAGAAWNDTYWSNERFNTLLVEARSELDNAKRTEMYGEMQRLVRDEGGVLLPFFANDVFGISDKVGHDTLSANYDVDGRMFFERWWFKES